MAERTARSDRRTATPNDTAVDTARANRSLRWGAYLLVASGVGFVLNGAAMLYRALFSAGFEAGVDALGGLTRAELEVAANHEVVHYIDHLHVNVAGLLVAVGVAVAALAWFGVRSGQRWALWTTVALPVVFLAHSLPIHQTAAFSFDALFHLGPGLLWLPALVVGAVLAGRGLREIEGREDGVVD